MKQQVLFQRTDEPEWVAVGRLAGLTDDGLIIIYPWREEHSAVDPRRLKIGRWVTLRVSWIPDRDLTAEIDRVEPYDQAVDDAAPVEEAPDGACLYHLRLRNYGWDDGPGSAPRTAPLLPRPGESDAHAEPDA